jgi:hemoglobin
LRWRKDAAGPPDQQSVMHSFPGNSRWPLVDEAKHDIDADEDVVQLVDAFYARVQADDLLGPIFNEVARVDWDAHLPKMYAFWQSVLFGKAGFRGNPLMVHKALSRLTPLTEHEFERWLSLFHATVDERFEGATADEAKRRSVMIATTMLHHVTT